MQTQEIFPGYVAEKLPETSGNIGFAYKVTGPRKEFMLLRNVPNPTMLFVCTEGAKVGKIRGYSWFCDRDGNLKPSH
jgi:hypothetical protein